MKAEKVLKIFAEAVDKKEYRFVTDTSIIEKDGRFFTFYNNSSNGTGFVREEKQGEPFVRLIDLGSINTLKGLKMRLGL